VRPSCASVREVCWVIYVSGSIDDATNFGIWPSFAPLGYINVDGANGKRTIVPDSNLAPVITRMFEQYATGKFLTARL
jgi:hypothetical protein